MELLNKHNTANSHVVRDTIKDLILSTDMAYHSELVKQADQLVHLIAQARQSSNKRKHSTSTTLIPPTNLDSQNRTGLCRILLHAADISNMARPWVISKQWSDLIVQEFFSQGDEERKRKMTISPGMDRKACSQPSISLKFGQLILPYFESLVTLLPKSHVFVDFLLANRTQWERLDQHKQSPVSATIRRVSSDIRATSTTALTTPSPTIANAAATTATAIKYKRIRLGFRSKSFPTVLYQHHHHYQSNVVIEENNLLPLVNFKSSLLYDTTKTNIESIVLYHPYDQ